MKNNDFEFIKNKFDADNITAPEGLSESAVKDMLDKADDKPVIKVRTNNKSTFFKAFIAVAACFAIVAVSISTVNYYNKWSVPLNAEPVQVEGIKTYKDYDELKNEIKEAEKEYGGILKNFGIISKSSAAVADGEISAESSDAANATGTGGKAESFASTNKQVDAVDEADIVKTDGKYIYYINDMRSRILIYSATDGKTELVSKIKSEDKHFSFSEMYIYGDKLIAVGSKTEYEEKESRDEDEEADGSDYDDGIYYDYYEGETYSYIYTYDITDRASPELVDTYEQSGYYNSSRMIGEYVYLISTYGRGYYYGYKNRDFIPCAGDGEEKEELAINDICGIEGAEYERYSVIGAVDVKSGKARKTKAVIGVNEQLYCNEKNLYLTGTYYKVDTEYTRIVKYSLDGTDIELKATGKAKGSVNDQFSMDEKDGNLRIALTDYRWGEGRDRNYLYVLDKKLEIIGQTEGFAKNEHIEAVRFIGDTAYVITFERTDPLFIIDLKNPKEPKITGEVKIDGFSSQLIPVDENTMLGIGFCTSEEEFGIVRDGLKLALFDISDKNEPKVLDEYEIKNADSAAQYSHKAITVNKDDGYFAIPFDSYSYDDYEDDYGFGALVIRADGGELSVKKHSTDEAVNRCTYIGNYLYALATDGGEVFSFEIQ